MSSALCTAPAGPSLAVARAPRGLMRIWIDRFLAGADRQAPAAPDAEALTGLNDRTLRDLGLSAPAVGRLDRVDALSVAWTRAGG